MRSARPVTLARLPTILYDRRASRGKPTAPRVWRIRHRSASRIRLIAAVPTSAEKAPPPDFPHGKVGKQAERGSTSHEPSEAAALGTDVASPCFVRCVQLARPRTTVLSSKLRSLWFVRTMPIVPNNWKRLIGFCASALCLLVASAVAAPPVTVHLQSGRSFTGYVDLDTSPAELVLRVEMGRSTLWRPIAWDRVVSAEIDGRRISAAEFQAETSQWNHRGRGGGSPGRSFPGRNAAVPTAHERTRHDAVAAKVCPAMARLSRSFDSRRPSWPTGTPEPKWMACWLPCGHWGQMAVLAVSNHRSAADRTTWRFGSQHV